jgi:hypothetical protein
MVRREFLFSIARQQSLSTVFAIPPAVKQILRLAFHLSPLLPIYFDYYGYAAANALLVLICYVKTFKLRAHLKAMEADRGITDESTRKAMRFWQSLTFLKA